MINKDSGTITFELKKQLFVVNGSFSKNDFLDSDLGHNARRIIHNEPHISYGLYPCVLKKNTFPLCFYFFGEKLDSLDLNMQVPDLENSWENYSEEKEIKRKQLHDQWLSDMGIKTDFNYAWGKITSSFDPRGGSSNIGIQYTWQGKPLT